MSIETRNPATEALIMQYQEHNEVEVKNIIDKMDKTYHLWRKEPFDARSIKMRKVADLLNKNCDEYALIISQEMGKPISAARAEVKKCAWVCEHYAENASDYLASREIKTEMTKSFVTYQPLGIVFAIMPWNFPFWQVFRFAAPTLMAGNAAILKHAPISTGTALAIEKIFLDAGFPKNLFRSLILSNEGAASVIANPHVVAVTLTGSERAGSAVAIEAGKALKKVVLELGGSDPYLILEDADLDAAAEACVTSRMSNSGQVCIAAKRIIIVGSIQDKFKSLVLERCKKYVMGDPMDENTNFGPIAREDLRDEIHRQVELCVEKGAKIMMGGEIPNQKGYYYPPTVLDNVKKGMPAYDEEIFGPVIAFINVDNEEEAINIANDTPYGLAAAVFSSNIERAEKIATTQLEAGTCAINSFVGSDPRLPFGGIKLSGYGRELSKEGIRAFTNVKTVTIK